MMLLILLVVVSLMDVLPLQAVTLEAAVQVVVQVAVMSVGLI